MDIDISNNAFLIHYEDSPLVETLLTQDAITLGHLAVGPEIAQQGDILHVQRFGPSGIGGGAVHTYTQNLGIYLLEALSICLVGGNLNRSDGCPRQGVER